DGRHPHERGGADVGTQVTVVPPLCQVRLAGDVHGVVAHFGDQPHDVFVQRLRAVEEQQPQIGPTGDGAREFDTASLELVVRGADAGGVDDGDGHAPDHHRGLEVVTC